MVVVRFLKSVDYDALYFHTGSLKIVKNQHFQSSLLGGRGSQKRILCMLLIILTILDPLIKAAWPQE